MNFIKSVNKIEELSEVVNDLDSFKFNKYESNTNVIIKSIDNFIRS